MLNWALKRKKQRTSQTSSDNRVKTDLSGTIFFISTKALGRDHTGASPCAVREPISQEITFCIPCRCSLRELRPPKLQLGEKKKPVTGSNIFSLHGNSSTVEQANAHMREKQCEAGSSWCEWCLTDREGDRDPEKKKTAAADVESSLLSGWGLCELRHCPRFPWIWGRADRLGGTPKTDRCVLLRKVLLGRKKEGWVSIVNRVSYIGRVFLVSRVWSRTCSVWV